jgi:hypothetical protein
VIGPPEPEVDAGGVDRKRIRCEYGAALDRGLARRDAIKAVAAELGVGRRAVFDALVDELETEE